MTRLDKRLPWLAIYQPQLLALLEAVAESSEYPDVGDLPSLALVDYIEGVTGFPESVCCSVFYGSVS